MESEGVYQELGSGGAFLARHVVVSGWFTRDRLFLAAYLYLTPKELDNGRVRISTDRTSLSHTRVQVTHR